jgi:hypothetical protein
MHVNLYSESLLYNLIFSIDKYEDCKKSCTTWSALCNLSADSEIEIAFKFASERCDSACPNDDKSAGMLKRCE